MSARPRLVLDASAGLHAALGLPLADEIFDRIAESTIVLAPGIYSAEVANGLYKYVKAGTFSEDRALELYDFALGLVDQLVAEPELAREALSAAVRHGHPVYDGLYGILARRNGSPVLTLDRRLRAFLDQIQVPAIALAESTS